MLFSHSPQLLDQFPQLAVTALSVTGITAAPDLADTTRPFLERATARLVQRPESEFPEITRGDAHQPDGPETDPIPWRRRRCCAGFGRTACCRPSIRCRRVQRRLHRLHDSHRHGRPSRHQVLISSTSVRTSLGASGCHKSKHQRAETKHGNQDANDQIVAAVPHRMQDHHGHENANSDEDGASAMRRSADPSDCRH